MARLTQLEREMLMNQQHLEIAIMNQNRDAAALALVHLGFFEDALAIAESPEVQALATRRVAALANEACSCPPRSLTIKDGPQSLEKEISNWGACKVYPNGTLWRCSDCGTDIFMDGFPDEHTAHLDQIRTNFPGKGEGPDTHVLKNATKNS